MCNTIRSIRWIAPLLLIGLFQMPAGAQTKDHLAWLFGNKKTETPATKAASGPHLAEVSIELAWLADPATFPYFLEAHSDGAKVEVSGYVPSKAVREKAVNLAKFYTSLPIVDNMTENTSLVIRPSPTSAKELEGTVQTALRETFPSSYTRFDVQCYADGKVEVSGAVNSLEEKLVLSQTLRRQHGSTSVVNRTHLQGESLAQSPATAAKKSPPAPEHTAKDSLTAAPAPFSLAGLFGKTTPKKSSDPAPAPKIDSPAVTKSETAVNVSPIVQVSASSPATKSENKSPETSKVTAAAMLKLKKTIEATCPGARPVQVTQSASGRMKLEINARTEADRDRFVDQIFSLPELQSSHFDLTVNINETEQSK